MRFSVRCSIKYTLFNTSLPLPYIFLDLLYKIIQNSIRIKAFCWNFGLLRISDTTVWATWSPIWEDMHMNEEILVLMHTKLDCLSGGSSLSLLEMLTLL